jgi:hypothetical protein
MAEVQLAQEQVRVVEWVPFVLRILESVLERDLPKEIKALVALAVLASLGLDTTCLLELPGSWAAGTTSYLSTFRRL